jgi:hypothetical protein
LVNNLRTDKAQVLRGCKQHKPQLIVREIRIVITRLAGFGCVCVLQAKFEKVCYLVVILRFSIKAGIVTEIRTQ